MLYFVTRFSFLHFCPYESSQYEEKGYNTRESIKSNLLVINLAFLGFADFVESKNIKIVVPSAVEMYYINQLSL